MWSYFKTNKTASKILGVITAIQYFYNYRNVTHLSFESKTYSNSLVVLLLVFGSQFDAQE